MRTNVLPRRRPRQPSVRERRVGYGLLLLLAAIVGLFLLAGARPGPAGLPPPPAAGQGALLPLTTPGGWPRGEIERYDADSLFEKINGKADAYLALAFEALAFASYARPDDPATYIDVYLYDMQAPLHAYGVYRAQRSGNEQALDAGGEAGAVGASVFARKDRFYFEVIASGGDAAAEARALARAIAQALPTEHDPVTDPAYLPRAGLQSVRYVRESGLGIDALTDAFLAVYADGTQVVVARPASPEAACKEALESFAFLKTPAEFAVQGAYAVGVVGAPDPARAKALLAEILELLE
ncbi:MAG: DUF6599 family protein [Planctomycetota bacterium]|jgi:hypothetical protein